jgi:hypothetical protein
MNTKAPTAWNDPPIVTPKIKSTTSSIKPEMPAFFQPTMPATSIPTANVFQPNAVSTFQSAYNQMYQPATTVAYDPAPNFLNQFQPSVNVNNQMNQSISNNGSQNYNQTFQPSTFTNNNQAVLKATPPPIVENKMAEKLPIPVEHQMIKSVFDNLLNKCIEATNAPVVKRKLDDVGKKLDILYDKLRESTVNNEFLV